MELTSILVGCCGKAGLSLNEYSKVLKLMEIQDTFYRIVREETLRKWRKTVGGGFELTMKAFQGLTHPYSSPTWRRAGKIPFSADKNGFGLLKNSREVAESWKATVREAEAVEASYIIVQLPPSFRATESNAKRIAEFFSGVDKPVPVGVEVRGRGWLEMTDVLGDSMEEAHITHVVDPLVSTPIHVDGPAYFRLHGKLPGYDYQYTTDELKRLAEGAGKNDRAYVLFNNLAMLEDALRFKGITSGREIRLPGIKSRAREIFSKVGRPIDVLRISRRYGFLRVGVDGEPTIAELINAVGGRDILTDWKELVEYMERGAAALGTFSDRTSCSSSDRS